MYGVNVSVRECTEGDMLAADIYNESGVLLIAKHTEINTYIKDKLIEAGIENIRISYSADVTKCDKYASYQAFEQDHRTVISSFKQIVNDLSAGRKLDYNKVADASDLIYRSINENENIIKCLNQLARADQYTYNHCVNTAFYSMLIAKWLKMQENEIKKVIQSGLLHDIGKIRIPNEVLNKKDRLSFDEFDLIKKHTIYGYGLLNDIDGIDPEVKKAVLLHHERADRSGYPFNASPDYVGLYAKIIAVADVFDAMTSDRIYKKRATPFDAFTMFITEGIGIFDTTILRVFLENISNCYIGTKVMLSNGEAGEIAYVPPQNVTYPIIKVSSEYIDLSQRDELRILSII